MTTALLIVFLTGYQVSRLANMTPGSLLVVTVDARLEDESASRECEAFSTN